MRDRRRARRVDLAPRRTRAGSPVERLERGARRARATRGAAATSIRSSAKSGLSRATTYAPTIAAASTRTRRAATRPEGSSEARTAPPALGGAEHGGTRQAVAATPRHSRSPRRPMPFGSYRRRQLERAEEPHLVLELDAELARGRGGAPRPSARARRPSRASPAFSMKFACRGEICAPPIRWPAGRTPRASARRSSSCVGVLEDASERPLVRRLGRLALRLQLGDGRLDLLRGPRREPHSASATTWPRPQRRAPVLEPELGGREPAARRRPSTTSARSSTAGSRRRRRPRSSTRRRRPFPGSRTRTRSRRARRRGRGAGRRRSPRRRRRRGVRRRRLAAGELAGQPEHERIDALVGDEQVRAEPDRPRPRGPRSAAQRERLLELGRASRGRANAARGPARARASCSRASGTSSSIFTQSASSSERRRRGRRRRRRPSARRRPARARPARKPRRRPRPRRPGDAASRAGARASASTTSLPLTPVDRLLARAVDLRHARRRPRPRAPRRARARVARPRVEMRLEERRARARRVCSRGGATSPRSPPDGGA